MIANLKLLWYVFYSQTVLHVQYEGIPLSIIETNENISETSQNFIQMEK